MKFSPRNLAYAGIIAGACLVNSSCLLVPHTPEQISVFYERYESLSPRLDALEAEQDKIPELLKSSLQQSIEDFSPDDVEATKKYLNDLESKIAEEQKRLKKIQEEIDRDYNSINADVEKYEQSP